MATMSGLLHAHVMNLKVGKVAFVQIWESKQDVAADSLKVNDEYRSSERDNKEREEAEPESVWL